MKKQNSNNGEEINTNEANLTYIKNIILLHRLVLVVFYSLI